MERPEFTALRLLESQILSCGEYAAVCSALPPPPPASAPALSAAPASSAAPIPSVDASPSLRRSASPTPARKRRRAVHDPHRLTVCLDLDETLIHSVVADGSTTPPKPEVDSFWLTVGEHELIVLKRPGLDDFLDRAAELFNLYVFTAGTAAYATPVLDHIDSEGRLFCGRLFRRHCTMSIEGQFAKNLECISLHECWAEAGTMPLDPATNAPLRGLVDRDGAKVGGAALAAASAASSASVLPPDQLDMMRSVLVDNNLFSFLPQPDNGVPISSFYGAGADEHLTTLLRVLLALSQLPDVKPVLRDVYGLHDVLRQDVSSGAAEAAQMQLDGSSGTAPYVASAAGGAADAAGGGGRDTGFGAFQTTGGRGAFGPGLGRVQ